MGITAIYPIILQFCPQCIRDCKLSDYKGKTIAIDGNNFMYRFMYGNNVGSHLIQFAIFYCDMVAAGITPLFVFDGKAPAAKQAVKDAREKRKVDHTEKVENMQQELKRKKIEEGLLLPTGEPSPRKQHDVTPDKKQEIQNMEEELKKVQKQIVHVDSQHINEVKTLLKLLGATVIQAHSEGEATCAVLNRLGMADAVMAEDSDVIAFGGVKLIRGVGGSSNREAKMKEYDIPSILDAFELNSDQFIEVSILCKSDFTSKIKGIGAKTAINLIREKYSIENIIRDMEPEERAKKIPEDFNPKEARKIFYEFLKRKDVFEYAKDIRIEPYVHENVCAFLKGKLPMYRETASEWCQKLTGVWPKNVWYGSDEDEDTRSVKNLKTDINDKNANDKSSNTDINNNNSNLHKDTNNNNNPLPKSTISDIKKKKNPFASFPPPRKPFQTKIDPTLGEPKNDT